MPRPPNPYVGPAPFKLGQELFGRTHEVAELRYLLTSERIVLLYSPSGAGKSSLIQAGLVPKVADRFDVWGVARVNARPPEGSVCNRYVWSVIASLEKLDTHPFTSLKEYAAQRPPKDGHPLLIIDQFEEVLRVDPTDIEAKRDFFEELGDLLADPGIWALLVLREDYLAPLDPYARYIPTQLQNRFRIDRLTTYAAIEAIEKPAALTERCYAPGVVKKLVDDLATVQVQLADGSTEPRIGAYVEPLQLQVVCFDLWERQRDDDMSIDPEDVGDIGDALMHYYDSAVQAAAGKDDAVERAIRDWFQKQLITSDGVRNQVRHEARSSGGLDNALVDLLLETYLVRAEPRGGTSWFELSHDRLVRPIVDSNRDWIDRHSSKWQKAADLWEDKGHPDGLLVIDADLAEAQRWASQEAVLGGHVTKFLEKSAQKQAAADRERKQARRLRRLAIGSTLVSVLALIALVAAAVEYLNVKQERLIGAWQSAARQAAIDTDYDRSALLARQAYLMHLKTGTMASYLVETALQNAAMQPPAVGHVLLGHQGLVLGVAFSPDGKRLISASYDQTVRVWELDHPEKRPLELKGIKGAVRAVAFSPDGKRIAAGGDDFSVLIWDASRLNEEPVVLAGHEGLINSIAFSRDGKHLASASADATVRVWDMAQLKEPPVTLAHDAAVNSAAFSPVDEMLASGSADGKVRLWFASKGPALILSNLKDAATGGGVLSVAFSPDGSRLAAGDNKWVRVWDATKGNNAPVGLATNGSVYSVAFSPKDANRLAVATTGETAPSGHVQIWNLGVSPPVNELFLFHEDIVSFIAFSPDSSRIASASYDKTVRVWDLQPVAARLIGSSNETYQPAPAPGSKEVPVPLPASIYFVDLDGDRLTSFSNLTTVQSWNLKQPAAAPTIQPKPGVGLEQQLGAVTALAFTAKANRLAAVDDKKIVFVWDLSKPAAPPVPLAGSLNSTPVMVFSPDGNSLAAGDDKNVRVWNVNRPADEAVVLSGEMSSALAFAPDGNQLAVAEGDMTVRVWNLQKPKDSPAVFPGNRTRIDSLALDGKRLASGSHDEAIRVWDLGNPAAAPIVLTGHHGDITALAFSPDGIRLASGSADKSVGVWDLQQPAARPVFLSAHEDQVNHVAFARDGNHIVSGGKEGKVVLWPLWTAAAESVCTRVWRNLSMEEWNSYIGESIPYERTCANLPPGTGAPGGPQ